MPSHWVDGVLRRSVLLSVNDIPPSEKVVNVQWDFYPQNGTGLIMAEFRDGKWERLEPKHWFGQRLEMVNETMLRIQNLKKWDSGLYKVRIRLHPAKIQDHTFHLIVYDPVPKPQISALQETTDSSSGCNMTLQCSVPEKRGLNVSWRIGDTLKPLEGGPDRYQLSSKGWHLHLSDPMDSSVTCLVSNPADQKMASFDLTSNCSHRGGNFSSFPLQWRVFPFALVITILLAAGFWIWKKCWKQPDSKDSAVDSALEVNKAPEVQSPWHPSEGDSDQELCLDSEQRLMATTSSSHLSNQDIRHCQSQWRQGCPPCLTATFSIMQEELHFPPYRITVSWNPGIGRGPPKRPLSSPAPFFCPEGTLPQSTPIHRWTSSPYLKTSKEGNYTIL